jgi:WhiB family redox-sensing transcriptional regulator
MAWKEFGACRDVENEIFFDPKSEDIAKAICDGCYVVVGCLRDALKNREQGIWGGTNDMERYQMREAKPAVDIKIRNHP